MNTPSRARPSDRAIAAAFWEGAPGRLDADQWIAHVEQRARELDTEPRAGDGDACSDPRGHAWRIPVEGNSTCVFCPAIKSDWPELAAQRNEGDGS